MTIGIALKSKDSIILACDSQATLGGAPYKTSTSKLEQLDQYHGLVMAGAEDVSKRVVEMLRGYLEREQNSTTERIADMTSELMADLYRTYGKRFEKDPVTIANEMSSYFLIGGVDENRGQQIYRVSSPGIFAPVDHYGLIGSGTFYAGTIMKKEYVPDMVYNLGLFLATRAVAEASEMDPYVGGEIRLAGIIPSQGFIEIPQYAEQRFVPLNEELRRVILGWERKEFGQS